LILNIGHFIDHLFTLIFASVAALVLYKEWGVSYAELLIYATPGFLAFGLFSLPAGWLADKWSRDGMMSVFFIGIGLASISTGFAENPFQIGIGLFFIGIFAAIYHPVGLAIVTTKWANTGVRIAVNGVWGNLGVAAAALITGYLIDHSGWPMAFILPGTFSILMGVLYLILRHDEIGSKRHTINNAPSVSASPTTEYKKLLIRISTIVFLTTAVSSIIFQSTTFALPKIFEERLQGLAVDFLTLSNSIGLETSGDFATIIGSVAFIVFAVASIAQLIVGKVLDRFGPRRVYMTVATIQVIFFSAMPGLFDGVALLIALGFMLGAFGQIPINDFMIGKTAAGPYRARIYGVRYVVSFTVLAATLPLISFVYNNWGFDTLFRILGLAAFTILLAAFALPKQLDETKPQTS
ncbi:MAG: MFS transporter, partial [Rhodospirillaceae bacterium]